MGAQSIRSARGPARVRPSDRIERVNLGRGTKIGRYVVEEDALKLLEHCFAQGWGKRDWIEHDPDYDSIRDEPRFQALLSQLH